MSTKLNGDIAEQAVILRCLQNGWGVLSPIGDRLPYDLVLDINNKLIKIQVKKAFSSVSWGNQNYIVESRMCKTNRREIFHRKYEEKDFDFAICYISEEETFYIFPIEFFISYAGNITLVEEEGRQRKPKSTPYREAWHLIEDYAII